MFEKTTTHVLALYNIESRHLGIECPKEKIDTYNKVSLKRVGSTIKDDFKAIH
jgi:hypothetical protein